MLLGREVAVGRRARDERLVGDFRDGRRPPLLEQLARRLHEGRTCPPLLVHALALTCHVSHDTYVSQREEGLMEAKQRIVRKFYAARGRRDWDAVRDLLAADVVWHERDGDMDYSGEHQGRETVTELLAQFVEVTGGTFVLEPRELISTAEHVASAVRWRADRSGVTSRETTSPSTELRTGGSPRPGSFRTATTRRRSAGSSRSP